MGSYLDKPETTKLSTVDENLYLQIGSSSMQGWRINQEDAHNSIPNFGDKISFFAVYDGHGGSEVAEFCANNLPSFLKNLESYKNGDYERALKDAFIGFDGTLLTDNVISELKVMARKNPDYEESDEDEEGEEEIMDLHQEATMSLNEVLEKYKRGNKEKKTPKKDSQTEQAGAGPSSSSNKVDAGPSGSSSKVLGAKNSASDNEVSSSSGKPLEESEVPSSSTTTASQKKETVEAPDSTHSTIPAECGTPSQQQPDQSKPSVSSEVTVDAAGSTSKDTEVTNAKKTTDDDSAISSSSVQENGEVSGSSKAVTATGPSSSDDKSPRKASETVAAGGSSSGASSTPAGGSSTAPKIPNHISSSDGKADETESASSSTDEDDAPKKLKKVNWKKMKLNPANLKLLLESGNDDEEDDDDEDDDDLSNEEEDEDMDSDDDEDVDEDDLSNEELSGEEDDEESDLDNEFMNNMDSGPGKASGCTAVVALLAGRELYVANAGDSRCVVCRGGKVVEMSFDHKPEDDIEFQRIRKAGGRVTLDGRVNGGLNLSRAIGDHAYKMNKELPADEQMISAMPDIKRITIEPEDEFMVLACDGIWNYMTNEEVVGFVKQRIDQKKFTLAQICEELFHNCLAPNTMGDGTGCDNMTAIIVKFKPDLYELPPTSQVSDSNAVTDTETVNACKRLLPREDETEADALVEEPSEKRKKIDEDLTPSAVDTSTT